MLVLENVPSATSVSQLYLDLAKNTPYHSRVGRWKHWTCGRTSRSSYFSASALSHFSLSCLSCSSGDSHLFFLSFPVKRRPESDLWTVTSTSHLRFTAAFTHGGSIFVFIDLIPSRKRDLSSAAPPEVTSIFPQRKVSFGSYFCVWILNPEDVVSFPRSKSYYWWNKYGINKNRLASSLFLSLSILLSLCIDLCWGHGLRPCQPCPLSA